MESLAAEQPCPEYACTLTLSEHSLVDDCGIDGEDGDVWHFDELGRAGWPGPDGRFPDRKPKHYEPEPQELHGPYEVRMQEETRERYLSWVRPSWLMAVEDAEFECSMLGSPVVFSGDLRPTDSRTN